MKKSKIEEIGKLRIEKKELLKKINEIKELKKISQEINTFNNRDIDKYKNSSTNPEISEEEPEL